MSFLPTTNPATNGNRRIDKKSITGGSKFRALRDPTEYIENESYPITQTSKGLRKDGNSVSVERLTVNNQYGTSNDTIVRGTSKGVNVRNVRR